MASASSPHVTQLCDGTGVLLHRESVEAGQHDSARHFAERATWWLGMSGCQIEPCDHLEVSDRQGEVVDAVSSSDAATVVGYPRLTLG